MVAQLREGALKAGLEPRPIRCGAHERHYGDDMLIELDVAGIGPEPLVMTPATAAVRLHRIQFLQFLQHARRDAGIDDVVRILRQPANSSNRMHHGHSLTVSGSDMERDL